MRTLSEIYASAKQYRDQYLGLANANPANDSKLSVLDAITWMASACIWTFDNILDVFTADISQDISKRINGTALYYVNALKKFQMGDKLMVNSEGTGFSYPQVNENKRIIKHVSYQEVEDETFHDASVIYKVAKGDSSNFSALTKEELDMAREYLRQISFAGMHLNLVSRKGDVLVPNIEVYYDGGITPDDLYRNIEDALKTELTSVGFDGRIYLQKIEDAIQHVEHVVDTKIISIELLQYDDDGNTDGPKPVTGRYFVPYAGYVTQSSKKDAEADVATWKEALKFIIEE